MKADYKNPTRLAVREANGTDYLADRYAARHCERSPDSQLGRSVSLGVHGEKQ